MKIRSGGSKGFCLKENVRTVERAAAQEPVAAIAAHALVAAIAAKAGMTIWRPCQVAGLFSALRKAGGQDSKDTSSKPGIQCDDFCNGVRISLRIR